MPLGPSAFLVFNKINAFVTALTEAFSQAPSFFSTFTPVHTFSTFSSFSYSFYTSILSSKLTFIFPSLPQIRGITTIFLLFILLCLVIPKLSKLLICSVSVNQFFLLSVSFATVTALLFIFGQIQFF